MFIALGIGAQRGNRLSKWAFILRPTQVFRSPSTLPSWRKKYLPSEMWMAARHARHERRGMGADPDWAWMARNDCDNRFGSSAEHASVASPIICRSALAIEAHRGVASLANTLSIGCALRLALRSDGCA